MALAPPLNMRRGSTKPRPGGDGDWGHPDERGCGCARVWRVVTATRTDPAAASAARRPLAPATGTGVEGAPGRCFGRRPHTHVQLHIACTSRGYNVQGRRAGDNKVWHCRCKVSLIIVTAPGSGWLTRPTPYAATTTTRVPRARRNERVGAARLVAATAAAQCRHHDCGAGRDCRAQTF